MMFYVGNGRRRIGRTSTRYKDVFIRSHTAERADINWPPECRINPQNMNEAVTQFVPKLVRTIHTV